MDNTDGYNYSGEKSLIDAPIRSSVEDDLGRAPVAHAFARSILELDASQGLVVGILGPWGHGKSSFINLMREEFEGISEEIKRSEESEPTREKSETKRALAVIDFNPWMFSGSDQLINFFFTQIGAELEVKNESRLGKIADRFEKYAGILRPVSQLIPLPGANAVGETVAAGISGLAGTTSADRSVQKVKKDITEALNKLEKPIVVVVDDIDRLTTAEIREIFKLVRLAANFPNIIYLLAFDRERVEQALSEDGIPGRAYLEKIVLLSFDVPQVSKKLLRSRVFAELDRILAPIANTTLDEIRWHDIYFKVIDPLLSNIRDVTRYAISVKPTIKDLGNEIDLVDLLAMEALRVFRPEIFQHLSQLRTELTTTHNIIEYEDERFQNAIENLLNEFPDDEVIRALLEHVFPAAQHLHTFEKSGIWLTAHRMTHIDFLNLYLDRVAPDGLEIFRCSEYAFELLNDEQKLKKYLSELVSEKLQDVIEGIEFYKDKFTEDMIIPGSITLLNLIDIIPDRKQKSFRDVSRKITVGRVVRELLRSVKNEKEREEFVSQILTGIETYSSELFLIYIVGYGKNIEEKLVSEKFMKEIYANFIKKLQNTSPGDPTREWSAASIYKAIQAKTGKVSLDSGDAPALLRAVLHSLKYTTLSQSDSWQVRSEENLDWKSLVQLFGSEDEIRIVVENVRKKLGDDEVLQLVDKYLQGWRPEPLS